MARSVVYQQLSGKAAAAIFARLCALGSFQDATGAECPTPEVVLASPAGALRAVGMSGAKERSLRDMAERSLNGTIGMFGKYECWSGFAVAQNGSGTWIGSQEPNATLTTLKRCTPGNWPAASDASSIATSIVSPSKAFASVKSDVVDAAITLGLALFLTFPSNVFNSTFEENYADIAAWWGKWTALLFPFGLRRALGKEMCIRDRRETPAGAAPEPAKKAK